MARRIGRMRGSFGAFRTWWALGAGSGRGLPAGLMAPRVSWRWGRGWHLCGEISQFSIASGNWQIVAMGLVSRGLEEG